MDSILTKGSPIRGIILFSIPLLLGNIFQQIYTISDTLIVGRVVGVQALAAVGATGGLTFLIIGFAQGMTTGLSIVTAQYFGAGDVKKVRTSFATSIWVCLIATIILTALSVGFTNELLQMMNTPKVLITGAETFLKIIFGGLGATMFFNLLSNMLRALGNSRAPLIFLAIACVINVVLDIVLIVYLHMGIAGAGYATVTAQLLSCIFCWIYIRRQVAFLRVERADMKLSFNEMRKQVQIGLPMGFQASIIAIGSIILQVSLNGLGPQAIAAYTAAGKVDQIAVQPMMSLGITMATFTAQNYGAKLYNRILIGIRQSLTASVSYAIAVGILIIINSRFLVNLFIGNSEQHITNLAHQYFLIVSISYFLLAILFIIRYTLQGFGKSIAPTFAGIAELFSRLFVGIWIVPAFGFLGACFANPLAWLGSNIVLIYSYLQTVRQIKRDAKQTDSNQLAN